MLCSLPCYGVSKIEDEKTNAACKKMLLPISTTCVVYPLARVWYSVMKNDMGNPFRVTMFFNSCQEFSF